MNSLEDAFWSARAISLAIRAGGRAAIVVKRGKRLAESVSANVRQAPLTLAVIDAGTAARGATVYVAHAPTLESLEHASRARVRRIVLPSAVELGGELETLAERARIEVARAVADDGSPWNPTGSPTAGSGGSLALARSR